MIKIHIFGDSLMKGTVINGDLRYRATMRKRIEAFESRYPVQISNHSRFGITVEQGAELLQEEINNGMQCDYVLMEFGGNDCNFDWPRVVANPGEEHQPMIPLSRFKQVLGDMVDAVKGIGAQPILMTLPPINADKYLNYLCDSRGIDRQRLTGWLGDKEMLYRFHELYSRAVEDIARQHGARLMDVRAALLGNREYYQMLGCDGLHMSDDGYTLLEQLLAAGYRVLQENHAQAVVDKSYPVIGSAKTL